MLFSKPFQAAALLLSAAAGFKFSNGKLAVGQASEKFTCCDPLKKSLPIGEREAISLKFDVFKPDGEEPYRPDQVVVVLTNPTNGLEQYVVPTFKDTSALINLPIDKVSKNLLLSGGVSDVSVRLSIIAADGAIDAPVEKSIGSIVFPEAVIKKLSKGYTAPSRYAVKPEIKHTFRQPDKQANKAVAFVFIGLIVAAFVWFLGTLAAHGSINLKNFGAAPGEPSVYLLYKIAFVGSIVAFEVFFVQYYLGDLIFGLIFKTAVLAGPSVWFGSRVFRSLLQKRIQSGN